MRKTFIGRLATIAILALWAGFAPALWGGGPNSITVTVTPATATIRTGQGCQFRATVTGTSNLEVNWTVTGGQGLDRYGYFNVWTPGVYTAKATSLADSQKFGTATITVISGIEIQLRQYPNVVYLGEAVDIYAEHIGGTNPNWRVNWTNSEGLLTPSNDSRSAKYISPSMPGNYSITATSIEDPYRSSTITITVLDPSTVTMSATTSPSPISGPPLSKAWIYPAIRGGSTQVIQWSATGGIFDQIETTGNSPQNYQLPGLAGPYQIRMSSKDDPTKIITIPVTVVPNATPSIYGIEVRNQAFLPGNSALVTPYFTAAGATVTMTPSVGTVANGSPSSVQPNTLTSYLLTLKVNSKTSLTQMSDWVGPAMKTEAIRDNALIAGTKFDLRTNPNGAIILNNDYCVQAGAGGQSVVIRQDGKIVVAGGGIIDIKNPFYDADQGSFPVPDERVFDSFTNTATTSGTVARTGHTALLQPNGSIAYFGGSVRDGLVFDPTISDFYGTHGGEVSKSCGFRNRYAQGSALIALDGQNVLIGGIGAWAAYQDAEHNWFYINERHGSTDWVEIQDPITKTIEFTRMRYKRDGCKAILLKDGRIFVTGGGGELPEVLDLNNKSSSLTKAFSAFFDSRNSKVISVAVSAAMMQDGKILILEIEIATNDRWIGIWDPVIDTYTRKLKIPSWQGSVEISDPISDGIFPIGSASQEHGNGRHLVFYESIHNTAFVSEDLKVPLEGGWIHYVGMEKHGDLLVRVTGYVGKDANRSLIEEPWRVSLDFPVKVFPDSTSIPLGSSYQLKAWSSKNETISWSVLEGATGGSISQDGTYHAPSTAGIYHVVATTPSGKSVSTLRVLPARPFVESLTLDRTSGTAGTLVKVQWQVQWANSAHLQTYDKTGILLTDQDVTGQTNASVTVTGNTALFKLVATNLSGSTEQTASFTQWGVSYVSVTPSGTLYLAPGGSRALQASVQGQGNPPQTVDWTCTGGTVTAEGVYVAPAVLGNYTVTATSTFDRSKSASVGVQVGMPPSLTGFTANPPIVSAGQAATLAWGAQGATGYTLTGVDESGSTTLNVGLSASTTNYVVRPSKTTRYTLSATNAFGADSRQVVVTVSPVTALTITPTAPTIYAGSTMTFGASITSTGSTDVTWTCSSGTLVPNDLSATFTAPSSPGAYTVTVAAVADTSRSATATVIVKAPEVTLSIDPTSATLYAGQAMTFGAALQVTGSSNTQVSWTATGGTISGSGLSAAYTAPATPGDYSVEVKSEADPTKTATATVTVVPIQVTLSITPSTIGIYTGQTLTFGSSIQVLGSTNQSVVWTCQGGTLTANGLSADFTAPANPGPCSVTVTSAVDPSKSATATVFVAVRPVGILVSPGFATLPPGGTQAFSARVEGAPDAPVTWSVVEPGGGTVTPEGIYTAPASPGVYTLRVASEGDPSLFNLVEVTVVAVTVAPQNGTLLPGKSLTFTAQVLGAGSQAVTWSVLEGAAGGTIDASGAYTAPAAQGVYHVQAATSDGKSAVVPVTVGFIDALVIAPDLEVLEAGTYRVVVRLKASNGKETEALRQLDMTPGMTAPELTFSSEDLKTRLGADGPYGVSQVRVERVLTEDVVPADERPELGSTQAYLLAQLQRPWVRLSGPVTALGEDLNGNGLIDRLKVTVGVEVVQGGNYFAAASLVDSQGRELDYAPRAPLHLNPGVGTLTLTFDGKEIASGGVDGPFGLSNLLVWGPASGKADFPDAITGFQVIQFEGSPSAPAQGVAPSPAKDASKAPPRNAATHRKHRQSPVTHSGEAGKASKSNRIVRRSPSARG